MIVLFRVEPDVLRFKSEGASIPVIIGNIPHKVTTLSNAPDNLVFAQSNDMSMSTNNPHLSRLRSKASPARPRTSD